MTDLLDLQKILATIAGAQKQIIDEKNAQIARLEKSLEYSRLECQSAYDYCKQLKAKYDPK